MNALDEAGFGNILITTTGACILNIDLADVQRDMCGIEE